jgi:predicted rRNA methylase YqxC with S4 and FtsJ domains
MACVTKVIEIKDLSNGEIAVTLRCCDDPSTDNIHTLNVMALDKAVEDAGTTAVGFETDVQTLIMEQVAKSEETHTALLNVKAQVEAVKASLAAAGVLSDTKAPSNP